MLGSPRTSINDTRVTDDLKNPPISESWWSFAELEQLLLNRCILNLVCIVIFPGCLVRPYIITDWRLRGHSVASGKTHLGKKCLTRIVKDIRQLRLFIERTFTDGICWDQSQHSAPAYKRRQKSILLTHFRLDHDKVLLTFNPHPPNFPDICHQRYNPLKAWMERKGLKKNQPL